MHDIDALVAHYGLFALFAGCFLEGETLAVTGGVLAHRHLLILWQVIAVVAAGAFCSDMFYFLLGRRMRENALVRKLREHRRMGRLLGLVDRAPRRIAAITRFVPGLRIAGPLTLAQTRIGTGEYALIAAGAALCWSVVFTSVGHVVGQALVWLFGGAHRTEHIVFIGIGLTLFLCAYVVWRNFRWRLRND
ncbi:DedA family protein [Albibacillus kandeliae]|uniref:DedA family protein n=1 Tax=Albibacillus kandeliae TaxID=2174228 RepID=UPI000D693229|nr:DedA family protein [Albibacillus kandeliae]